jgi:hypothetical protein
MPAKWARVNPVQLMAPANGAMATMVMATAAKKHVTIFRRSRRAPGAGSPEIKAAFTQAAHGTVGTFDRATRNAAISAAMGSFKGRSGPHYRKSKSKAHMGQRIQVGAKGY